jgi:hypothetical protein
LWRKVVVLEMAMEGTKVWRLEMTKHVCAWLGNAGMTISGNNIRVRGAPGIGRGGSMVQSGWISKMNSKLSGLELEPPESLVWNKNGWTFKSLVLTLMNDSSVELVAMLVNGGSRSGADSTRITTSAGTSPEDLDVWRGETFGY